jgi:uncharacterized membrane protein
MPTSTSEIDKDSSSTPAYARLDSIDFLRGLVMVIMLLDHTRDFVHSEATRFDPTDLSQTNVILFFTRWITHYCAPIFVFLAGTSIYLQVLRGKSKKELSKFLITRGFWLVVLEFTVVRILFLFNVDYSFFGTPQVIWAIGVSMMVLAGLIWLPVRVIGIIGIAMIALHNLLDGIRVAPTATPSLLQKIWMLLHQQGFFPLYENGPAVFVLYPLIPWVGVMMAGYFLGVVYGWEKERRQKFLIRCGITLILLFVAIRAINIYGDPRVWASQKSFLFTVLSFLNVTKYPPSLLFLLMTLGPAMLILAYAEKTKRNVLGRALVVFGRVPMFFYFLQWIAAHGFAVLLSYIAGKSIAHFFMNFPDNFTKVPPDGGFNLAIVYAVWLLGVLLIYPLCLWFSRVKQRRKDWWLSYL